MAYDFAALLLPLRVQPTRRGMYAAALLIVRRKLITRA